MTVSFEVTAMIEAVAEAHGLGRRATERLVRVVTGQVPGNRDAPLYALAATIGEAMPSNSTPFELFDLIGPDSPLSAGHRALLDFLVTTAAQDTLDALDAAIGALAPDADGASVQECRTCPRHHAARVSDERASARASPAELQRDRQFPFGGARARGDAG
jgi:hypothetical protein